MINKLHKLHKLMQLNYKFNVFNNATNASNNHVKLKNPRRWWVRPTNQKRETLGIHRHLIKDMRESDPEEFFRFTRMSVSTFDELLDLIKPRLQKRSIRQSIAPDIRLYITLRYTLSFIKMRNNTHLFPKKIFSYR